MKRTAEKKGMPIIAYIGIAGALLIAVVSATFFIGYQVLSDYVMKMNLAYTIQVFNQLDTQMQERLDTLEDILISAAINRTTASFVVKKYEDAPFDGIKEMDTLVLGLKEIEPVISEVVLAGENGAYYSSGGRGRQILSLLPDLPEEQGFRYTFPNSLPLGRHRRECFLLTTSMYNIWDYAYRPYLGKMTAAVEIDVLGIEDFSDQYGLELYILNDDGVCSTNQESVGDTAQEIFSKMGNMAMQAQQEISVDGRTYLVYYSWIDRLNSALVSILPKDSVTQELSWIARAAMLMMTAAIALMSVIMVCLSGKITQPLKKLGSHMLSIENGETKYFGNEIHLSGYREVQTLSLRFNRMVRKEAALTEGLIQESERLYSAQLQKKQAELLQLRSQINPHFLYNTLESLIGLAYLENAGQTAEMLKALARIFKYSVKGEDLVTVRDEMQAVKAYLSIQSVRFPELFAVEYGFTPDALDCRMPKMLLQPLVENAIVHGFSGKTHGGLLSVGGRREQNALCLWVRDNGTGFEPERLAYFQSLAAGKTQALNDSVGLENVIRRLKLIYEQRCAIRIESEPGVGSRVEIRIEREEDEDV